MKKLLDSEIFTTFGHVLSLDVAAAFTLTNDAVYLRKYCLLLSRYLCHFCFLQFVFADSSGLFTFVVILLDLLHFFLISTLCADRHVRRLRSDIVSDVILQDIILLLYLNLLFSDVYWSIFDCVEGNLFLLVYLLAYLLHSLTLRILQLHIYMFIQVLIWLYLADVRQVR